MFKKYRKLIKLDYQHNESIIKLKFNYNPLSYKKKNLNIVADYKKNDKLVKILKNLYNKIPNIDKKLNNNFIIANKNS